ncbi:MAG TPA: VOC family protein [candidate division Zixibacteria bacterium]|nr:VOC family protein [candidate division Zixibacteria bacterium]
MSILLSTVLGLSALADSAAIEPPTGIWAVQINVVDLDAALAFYTGTLEFQVLTREAYPRVVPLVNDGAHILLFACDSLTQWDYDRQCRINLNLYVEDLDDWTGKLRAAGARVLDDTALTAGVGKYIRFLDPSGNHLDLMELGYEHEPVTRPTVYNVGAQVSAISAARAFYEGLLGFEVLTEKYYPPVIPYKVNGLQLILHESGETPAQAAYPQGSQTLLTLVVSNLDEALTRLRAAGFATLRAKDANSPVGRYNAVRDPDGNVIELLEWKDNLFDKARRESEY